MKSKSIYKYTFLNIIFASSVCNANTDLLDAIRLNSTTIDDVKNYIEDIPECFLTKINKIEYHSYDYKISKGCVNLPGTPYILLSSNISDIIKGLRLVYSKDMQGSNYEYYYNNLSRYFGEHGFESNSFISGNRKALWKNSKLEISLEESPISRDGTITVKLNDDQNIINDAIPFQRNTSDNSEVSENSNNS